MPSNTSYCKDKLIKFIKHVIQDELHPVKGEHEHFKATLKSLVSEQLNLMSIIIRHHECIDNLYKTKHHGKRNKTLAAMSDSMEALHEHGDFASVKENFYKHPTLLTKPHHRKAVTQDSFHDILLAVGEIVEKCNDELLKQKDNITNDNPTNKRNTFTLPYYPPQSSMNQWARKHYEERNSPSIAMPSSSTDSMPKFSATPTTVPPRGFGFGSKVPERISRLKTQSCNKTISTTGKKGKVALKSNSINRLGTWAKDAHRSQKQFPLKLKGVTVGESKRHYHRTQPNPNAKIHYVDISRPTRVAVRKEVLNCNSENLPSKKQNKVALCNTAPIPLSIKKVDRLKEQVQEKPCNNPQPEGTFRIATVRGPRALKCGTGSAFGIFTLPHHLLQDEDFEQMSGIRGKQVRESGLDCETHQMQDFHSINKLLLAGKEEPVTAVTNEEVFADLHKKGSLYFYAKHSNT